MFEHMLGAESASLDTLSNKCLDRRERRARGWRHTLFAAAVTLGSFALVGALVSGLLR